MLSATETASELATVAVAETRDGVRAGDGAVVETRDVRPAQRQAFRMRARGGGLSGGRTGVGGQEQQRRDGVSAGRAGAVL
ncbi:hypothetical protein GCM10020219_102040 [Nonomuraea dietziae]